MRYTPRAARSSRPRCVRRVSTESAIPASLACFAVRNPSCSSANAINSSNRYRSGRLVVEVRFTLGTKFPYVHDRFAIIDDELWHFGATVGGLHQDVNAATRGWDVDDNDALRFFEVAWEGERNNGHRGTRA